MAFFVNRHGLLINGIRNYSAKKLHKVLDTIFLIFSTLSHCGTLVTIHPLAGTRQLAERA